MLLVSKYLKGVSPFCLFLHPWVKRELLLQQLLKVTVQNESDRNTNEAVFHRVHLAEEFKCVGLLFYGRRDYAFSLSVDRDVSFHYSLMQNTFKGMWFKS